MSSFRSPSAITRRQAIELLGSTAAASALPSPRAFAQAPAFVPKRPRTR
jgi:hypothetical protein